MSCLDNKAREFWEAALKMFDAQVGANFTPVSCVLATAAMSEGAKHTGVVDDSQHPAWQQSFVDDTRTGNLDMPILDWAARELARWRAGGLVA